MSEDLDSIKTAYSFFHQKLQVYRYSALEWQKDDIEYAIGEYVSVMNRSLYSILSENRPDYLRFHSRFEEDLSDAVYKLERMIV